MAAVAVAVAVAVVVAVALAVTVAVTDALQDITIILYFQFKAVARWHGLWGPSERRSGHLPEPAAPQPDGLDVATYRSLPYTLGACPDRCTHDRELAPPRCFLLLVACC